MTTRGERLKNVRLALKLSQEELGAKLGISAQHYCNVEMDNASLNNEKLVMLFNNYNVNLNYLVCGYGPMFVKVNEFEMFLKKINKILSEENMF